MMWYLLSLGWSTMGKIHMTCHIEVCESKFPLVVTTLILAGQVGFLFLAITCHHFCCLATTWTQLIFFKLFFLFCKNLFLMVHMISHDPHNYMLYVCSPFSLCFYFFRMITWPWEVNIVLWSFKDFGVQTCHTLFLQFHTFLPFSHHTFLLVYIPIIKGQTIWSRVWLLCTVDPGLAEWQYGGGSWLVYTRHCQGLSGPSIKGISMPDVVIFDGTLIGLGSVHLLMVVNNVVSI